MCRIKNRAVLVVLCGVLAFSMISFAWCDSDEALWGAAPVFSEITYCGHLYPKSGEIIAKQQTPADLHPIGIYDTATNTATDYTASNFSSPDTNGSANPVIYAIDGVEPEEAIALKVLLISHKGTAWYYYFRYDRVL
ncbi:hypothetical protein [Dehalococcoides mccartyi]|uniref:Lipoprotein n=1 Tax=Dehalococcoides mccartyi (strain VS) TaxID=311424 RepID=D2BII2_DEHMV|nr:hypothetical protein [Dehalococcoides mccartyi]ACZ62132.1 hypothetical protein DhcVS_1015 [Dehalococcoides mccartyi VS]